jgi:hypothetical protein
MIMIDATKNASLTGTENANEAQTGEAFVTLMREATSEEFERVSGVLSYANGPAYETFPELHHPWWTRVQGLVDGRNNGVSETAPRNIAQKLFHRPRKSVSAASVSHGNQGITIAYQ